MLSMGWPVLTAMYDRAIDLTSPGQRAWARPSSPGMWIIQQRRSRQTLILYVQHIEQLRGVGFPRDREGVDTTASRNSRAALREAARPFVEFVGRLDLTFGRVGGAGGAAHPGEPTFSISASHPQVSQVTSTIQHKRHQINITGAGNLMQKVERDLMGRVVETETQTQGFFLRTLTRLDQLIQNMFYRVENFLGRASTSATKSFSIPRTLPGSRRSRLIGGRSVPNSMRFYPSRRTCRTSRTPAAQKELTQDDGWKTFFFYAYGLKARGIAALSGNNQAPQEDAGHEDRVLFHPRARQAPAATSWSLEGRAPPPSRAADSRASRDVCHPSRVADPSLAGGPGDDLR